MPALLLESRTPAKFRRKELADSQGTYSERWLQEQLFANPELVLLEEMETGAGKFVPLLREFPLPTGNQTHRLDILGVSRSGRLALVECKLWRNPQARREVVAQTLEYASRLRGLKYSDLTAAMRKSEASTAINPIYEAARAEWPDLAEAAFGDAVARSLQQGDFYLIVAGDGIRSDLHTISEHLNSSGLAAARFALLEIKLWADDTGRTLITPTVPVRTEVIQQRVLLSSDNRVVTLETVLDDSADSIEAVTNPDRAERIRANRAFWQRFIDTVEFDHPDQSAPRHGGDNWVKIPLPSPIKWITAYRNPTEIGFWRYAKTEEMSDLLRWLAAESNLVERETGLLPEFDSKDEPTFIKFRTPLTQLGTDQQLEWLREKANSLVNFFRPAMSQRTSSRGA